MRRKLVRSFWFLLSVKMIREWSREKPKRASAFSHSIDNTQHCTIATRVTVLKKAPIVVNSRTILADRRSESFSFTFAVNLITSKSLGKIYIKAAVCRFIWLVNNLISNKVHAFVLLIVCVAWFDPNGGIFFFMLTLNSKLKEFLSTAHRLWIKRTCEFDNNRANKWFEVKKWFGDNISLEFYTENNVIN